MTENTRNTFASYEHQGQPFNTQGAMEIIFKAYVGQPAVDEDILSEEVYEHHLSLGGSPPDVLDPEDAKRKQAIQQRRGTHSERIYRSVRSYVYLALRNLKRNGAATREKELWRIHTLDIDAHIRADEQTYPKKLGSGKQQVYLYYYPLYRKEAECNRPPVWKTYRKEAFWPCKIGETHDQDTETRVRQQGRVFPEKKVTALILKTDDSRQLEKIIQYILKVRGRHIDKDKADGTEWYLTSPAEVEDIYDWILDR